jgi:hypothetical protein
MTGTEPCRRKIEMSPGAQSRDDTPIGRETMSATARNQTLGEGERHPELTRTLAHSSM